MENSDGRVTSPLQHGVMCGDCKFWKSPGIGQEIPESLYNDYGECSNAAFSYMKVIGKRTDMLIYEDHAEYAAGFVVGKMFGCIHGIKNT